MPGEKKDNHPVTIRMEASIYKKLNDYCEETGVMLWDMEYLINLLQKTQHE